MAALVEGQQYGLFSQGSYSNSNSLIFVKLTDSALKSIEDYLKNKGSSLQKPTVQFEANHGVIHIPVSSKDSHSFGFTVSNTEADNPQGSFECIQQKKSRSLESLGSMLHKMQIHATEDSYEKTKHKMAFAEQQNKKNCTKVIKAAGPGVGRRVKVKRPLSSIPLPPPKPSSPHQFLPSAVSKQVVKPVSGLQLGGTNSSTPRPTPPPKPANSDILRKTYRERIIHLLAVRPYKKPELLTRLMKDGIKEKDKKSLSAILSQVAVLKDNSFSLVRHVWNEVQDDWPFYTPQERELMKRIPQKLKEMMLRHTDKRAPSGYEPYPGKKQRISHYQKPEVNGASPYSGFVSSAKPDSTDLTFVKADSVLNTSKKWEPTLNGQNGFSKTDGFSPKCSATENGVSSHTSTISSHLFNRQTPEPEKFTHWSAAGLASSCSKSTMQAADSSHTYINRHSSPDSNSHSQTVAAPKINNFSSKLPPNGYLKHHSSPVEERMNGVRRSKVSSTTNSTDSTPSSSPDSQDSLCFKGSQSHTSSPTTTCEVPDYLTKYVEITSNDQRARYKAHFNAEYEQYQKLHSHIMNVSRRFAELEDRLGSCEKGSQEWKKTTQEIKKEYKEQKRKKYQEMKRKYQYLHEKLAHIKRLVMEYDQCHS
ncbi:RNA polymerase II elongation factor ELL-like [Limulus polyphemus]|uniref:RNA polymerase II elongation factor ELL-like n=1 Tax=Limulus polyphemus TaxID=6850 RepID=A0ABM1BGL9_LIMPO|nr:RNA polymerase II elongation factor ELL-like [Limulus polyphemus]